MANSKNTIQNIPLASELCMNALKTEVKQFQGYNEKNTTLYGGTLSPMYDNTVELFDKDNSYTVFNSKGVPFTLVREGNQICLYKQNTSLDKVLTTFKKTEKLFVKNVDDMVMVAKAPDGSVLSVSRNRGFYIDNVLKSELTGSLAPLWLKDDSNAKVIDCQVFFVENKAVLMITFVGVLSEDAPGQPAYSEDKILSETCIFILDDNKDLHRARWSMFWGGYDWQKVPVFAFTIESDPSIVRVCVTNPLKTKASNEPTVTYPTYRFHQIVRVDIVNYAAGNNGVNTTGHPDEVFYEDIYQPGVAHYPIPQINSDDLGRFRLLYNEMARFAGRYVGGYVSNNGSYRDVYLYNGTNRYIPIESKDDITCPLGNYSDPASIYYLDGNLISIGIEGRPIIPCLSFSSNIITPYNQNGVYSITYKSGQNWYCFSYSNLSSSQPSDIIPYLKSLIVDNRFIFFANYVIDIENVEDGWEKCNLDWILADPVLSDNSNVDGSIPVTEGVVYAAGVNAGYTVSNAQLVGYLPNPYIGKVFSLGFYTPYNTVDERYVIPNIVDSAQYYWEVGDTSQSATYKGSDPQYYGTVYPIDPNGNVVLPISMSGQIIKGYSNNDMVKEGGMVYPLMYWNNNQKVYAYYLLAGIENITNVFSLQGQQYAVDDGNIYVVTFNGGVVSQVQSVSYKKNLTFLGTLPTQAVFWSDFNKTFYAFTGDRILSKMFEASDINEIRYVGQNPSSLSLWICSDTGIYIISDTDMFKLDFNSSQVSFMPQKAIIVAEGETNNGAHYISLYLNENEQGEMVPVKLKTSYYGLGNEMKAVMDCWYIRLFDKDRTEGYVKVKVNTITDVTRHTEEKTFKVNPSDYDDNNIFYLRYQPKYQECVAMQLELETNLGIYSLALGVNTTDSTAQVSKFNF